MKLVQGKKGEEETCVEKKDKGKGVMKGSILAKEPQPKARETKEDEGAKRGVGKGEVVAEEQVTVKVAGGKEQVLLCGEENKRQRKENEANEENKMEKEGEKREQEESIMLGKIGKAGSTDLPFLRLTRPSRGRPQGKYLFDARYGREVCPGLYCFPKGITKYGSQPRAPN
eukprot:g15381.t1